MKIPKPHAILLASPGMGHIIPVIELAKRFVSQHGFQVTVFVVATDASTVESYLCNSPEYTTNLFNVVCLPSVDISALVDTDASLTAKIVVMMHESLPALRSAISAMKPRPTAMIVDFFGTEAMMTVADEFGMLKYMFMPSNAWLLATMIYGPAIDEIGLDEHANKKLPLKIPGCTAVRFEDTLEPFLDVKGPMFQGFLGAGMAISTADGYLVNTWEDLEPKTLAALRDAKLLGQIAKAPVYPIGPLARPVSSPVQRSQILDWLDTKPSESVIYVSFGSGGSLSAKQMMELAWGLELSQQSFVWVVRPPIENDESESYLTAGDDSDDHGVREYLPDGFLSRTHSVGLVVPMWAPQADILGHPSVGGFLSHCGWNSTLESIVNGIPMIGWPLFAEQKMNATMLTEEIGVAVRSKASSLDGIVGREEIKMMIRRIMVDKEGHEMRSRVKEVKCSAEKALNNKGGSSYNSLLQVVEECDIRLQGQIAKARGS
ncbi:hypothetical protein Q3G72_008624 [Acer saccharum]|nr:hypothetical protein Q3G72_008624 [Acer saccharum]